MDFKELYLNLFAAAADATEAIEAMDFGRAKSILIAAQQQSEETYINRI